MQRYSCSNTLHAVERSSCCLARRCQWSSSFIYSRVYSGNAVVVWGSCVRPISCLILGAFPHARTHAHIHTHTHARAHVNLSRIFVVNLVPGWWSYAYNIVYRYIEWPLVTRYVYNTQYKPEWHTHVWVVKSGKTLLYKHTRVVTKGTAFIWYTYIICIYRVVVVGCGCRGETRVKTWRRECRVVQRHHMPG